VNAVVKKYLITAGIAAAVFAGGYAVGRFTTPAKVLHVEGQGTIEYRDRVVWRQTTNTGACCIDYNAVLTYLDSFLAAPPIVDETTRDTIRFHIMSNRYALRYTLSDVPVWHIAPILAGRFRWSNGPEAALGGGLMADYANIGGGLIVNGLFPTKDIDLNVFGYMRF
jgi:hypothetical protein